MIGNSENKLYTGVTQEPEKRVRHHNQGRGAKFTKHIPTYKIVFLEKHTTLADARKREVQIKKWRRDKKDMLIARYVRGLPTQPVKTIP